jgi:hypothetical protein
MVKITATARMITGVGTAALKARATAWRWKHLRNRQAKNFLAITILSLGMPMLLMGDEVRQSQSGNNTCRPDLVGFVNGLPLVVIELKKPGVPARVAFDEKLTH